MEQSIKSVYTWTNLRKDVERYCKTCNVCQRCKQSCKIKYGLLPEKKGEITKFSRVNVDLWGPKTVKNKNGWDYKIHIMTMVDPVTGWFGSCNWLVRTSTIVWETHSLSVPANTGHCMVSLLPQTKRNWV